MTIRGQTTLSTSRKIKEEQKSKKATEEGKLPRYKGERIPPYRLLSFSVIARSGATWRSRFFLICCPAIFKPGSVVFKNLWIPDKKFRE